MKKDFNNKKITLGAICLCILLITVLISYSFLASKNNFSNASISLATEEKNYVYLSDMDYITANNWSYNGWAGHSIQIDKNPEGNVIKLKVDGVVRTYLKGIGLHAKGQITYNIENLSNKYTRFTAKIGLDASRTANANIHFEIYLSDDGEWSNAPVFKTGNIYPGQDAIDVDIDITGQKYLRIYVDPNGANTSDHGVIANAKLVTADYQDSGFQEYDKLKTLDYYDNILSKNDVEYNYNNNYRLILEREFVRKIDSENINAYTIVYEEAKEALDWIVSENRILEECIEVGELSNPAGFIDVLSKLYHTYKEDLKTPNGYVYEKMMIAMAAAYSSDKQASPLIFAHQTPSYDYIERFSIIKNLFDNHKLMRMPTNDLTGVMIENEWFKDYHVELMRMVMQEATSNIDFVWLNGFTHDKNSISFWMVPYISPNYNQDRLYSEENRELYDTTYLLSKYNVPYGLVNGAKVNRYWMVIEAGGICWNESRFGQSMFKVNGIPATGAYQPAHEPFIQYYQNANGQGFWTTRYGGWASTGSTWGGGGRYRYIFDWANKYFTDQNISGSKGATSSGYLYLAQDNLNNLEVYKKSLYYNLIANSYTDNNKKLETYKKSIAINPINLDSYDYIISIYKNMSENGLKSSTDWKELAQNIIEAYKYYPVTIFDLTKVIRPYLEGTDRLEIDRLEKAALEYGTNIPNEETLHAGGAREHAKQLLGKAQADPATFSFDGADGGKIVKNSEYNVSYRYSLDGGHTFSNFTQADFVTLTETEIASITAENDIIIGFQGVSYTFTIDIVEGTVDTGYLYANDLENRVVGVDTTYEWRNSESDPWTEYLDASPDNTGDKTLYVRRKATKNAVASAPVTYTFTEDNQEMTRKYVPVSHLSIYNVSTEAPGHNGSATNAIDANYNTRWHSNWNGQDTQRFITIKLDKPRYVSAVEFVPAGGGNGKIIDGTIWGCYDDCDNDNNWIVLTKRTGIIYPSQANDIETAKQYTQNFEIEDPQEVQYIKIVADKTNGNWFAARAFNIYQDLTKSPRPTAGVGYSTTNPTRGEVIARLINVSVPNYKILGDGKDTYTFTEEGDHSYTFRFVDTDTNIEGSAVARVNWIDRTAPTAEIEYSTESPTNGYVVATLKPSEDVIVTNNGDYQIDDEGHILDHDGNIIDGYIVDDEGNITDANGNFVININTFTYEFYENGEFTFEFRDKAGNRGRQTAKVSWIDHEPPEATLFYDKTSLTNQDVNVTIKFNEEAIVTNNDGDTYTFKENGEFTFNYHDLAGNTGSITANVRWIDKIAPTAELKYERQGDKVIVTVINPSEEITYKEGIGVYEFTKNGNYEIIFYDKAGNEGKLVAQITGLPTNDDSPSNPSTPTEPSEPSTPNDNQPGNNPEDNNPSSPNNPGDSDNNNSTNPGNDNKPTNPSNPTNPSGSNNNSNSENNKPTTPSQNVTEPTNKDYKKYSNQKVVVEIPSDSITDDVILKVAPFALTSSMHNTFGDLSEFYDIYFQDYGQNRLDIKTTSPIKISIKRNMSKKLIGVYEITDDNTIKLVDFEKNGDNIELVVNSLGKYVVSYAKLELPSANVNIPIFTSKGTGTNPTIIGVLIVTIIGLALYIAKLNKELK